MTEGNPFSSKHVAVVVAHPDDETIGAGGALGRARRITLVHTTDGASSALEAVFRGFATRASYAHSRREELACAFRKLSVESEFLPLNYRDQRLAFDISSLARSLEKILRARKPDLVLTHAFEGGHPDHDATAMAVHLAAPGVPIVEMAGYHNAGGKAVRGSFISGESFTTVRLSPGEAARKRAMLSSFASQRRTIEKFTLSPEIFRMARSYCFTEPPHEGKLYYENHWMPMTAGLWRRLAARAIYEYEGAAAVSRLADGWRRRASLARNLVMSRPEFLG